MDGGVIHINENRNRKAARRRMIGDSGLMPTPHHSHPLQSGATAHQLDYITEMKGGTYSNESLGALPDLL